MNYYSHHIGDYRKDTAHLSLLEHGAYRQLLDTYYTAEKPLILDDAILMRTHCARSADEMQAVRNVLNDFFVRTEDGWVHKRCVKEIDAYHAKSNKAGESAKARWDRVKLEKDANALRTHTEGNANQEPITNNHKPIEPKNIGAVRADIFPAIADRQLVSDWKALRKSKKAAVTKTAIEGIEREAANAGLSLEAALRICCERGWAGFKAEWLQPESRGKPQSVQESRLDCARQIMGNQYGNDRPIIDISPKRPDQGGRARIPEIIDEIR